MKFPIMTGQCAKALNIAIRTVQKYCEDFNVTQMGRYYLIDKRTYNKIKKAVESSREGRPHLFREE